MIYTPILWFSRRRFLIGVHASILALGGAYTYAEVPLGYRVQSVFDFSHNPYDRNGHLAQGFIPAILAREIILRHTPLRRGTWLSFSPCRCVWLSAPSTNSSSGGQHSPQVSPPMTLAISQ
ncbi:MAG: DUF2238 domain-containing protein [bacterium]|nr:DUF2238 domain-containing protein [bacterium]